MTTVIVGGICLAVGFVIGFGVCANNYGSVEKLQAALKKAKQDLAG